MNIQDLFNKFQVYSPSLIKADGYYGSPSLTAVTPLTTICFLTIAVTKNEQDAELATNFDLDLPIEINSNIQNS